MSAPAGEGLTRRCDYPDCGRARAKAYEVIFEDGRIAGDLCGQHAQVLRDLRRELIRGAFVRLEPLRQAGHARSTAATPPEHLPTDL